MQSKLIVYPDKFQFIQVNWIFSSGNFQFIWIIFQFIWIFFQFIWIVFNLSGLIWNYPEKNTTLSGNRMKLIVTSLYLEHGHGHCSQNVSVITCLECPAARSMVWIPVPTVNAVALTKKSMGVMKNSKVLHTG